MIIQHEGVDVHVAISPCSWMYPLYGLQIQLSLAENASNAASVFERDTTIPLGGRDKDTWDSLALDLARSYLENKGLSELQAAQASWTVEVKKSRKADARRAKREERERTKMKEEGYTHLLLAWIHPASGDDDSFVKVYSKGKPTKKFIAGLLKDSIVKNDFSLTTL